MAYPAPGPMPQPIPQQMPPPAPQPGQFPNAQGPVIMPMPQQAPPMQGPPPGSAYVPIFPKVHKPWVEWFLFATLAVSTLFVFAAGLAMLAGDPGIQFIVILEPLALILIIFLFYQISRLFWETRNMISQIFIGLGFMFGMSIVVPLGLAILGKDALSGLAPFTGYAGLGFFLYPGYVFVTTLISFVWLYSFPDTNPFGRKLLKTPGLKKIWRRFVFTAVVGWVLIVSLSVFVDPLRVASFVMSMFIAPILLVLAMHEFPERVGMEHKPSAVVRTVYLAAIISMPIVLYSQVWFSNLPLSSRTTLAEASFMLDFVSSSDLDNMFTAFRLVLALMTIAGVLVAIMVIRSDPTPEDPDEDVLYRFTKRGLKLGFIAAPIVGILLFVVAITAPSLNAGSWDEENITAGIHTHGESGDYMVILIVEDEWNITGANATDAFDDSTLYNTTDFTQRTDLDTWEDELDFDISDWILEQGDSGSDGVSIYSVNLTNLPSEEEIDVNFHLANYEDQSTRRYGLILVQNDEVVDSTFHDHNTVTALLGLGTCCGGFLLLPIIFLFVARRHGKRIDQAAAAGTPMQTPPGFQPPPGPQPPQQFPGMPQPPQQPPQQQPPMQGQPPQAPPQQQQMRVAQADTYHDGWN